MFKALILDDEQHCIDRLSQLLNNQNGLITRYDYCNTVTDALKLIEKQNFDVIFLDVHLQNETGFDFLRKTKSNINFEVIFTTAYDTYAVKAFKHAALDYLLKPVDKLDLEQALDKLKTKKNLMNSAKKVETLLYNLSEENTEKVINLTNSEGVHIIKVNDILRCNADDNYTHIHTSTNEKITIAKTLKTIENLLEPYSFFRIHQSHLINILHVKKFLPKKRTVILSDETQIDVSIRKKEALLTVLKDR